MLKEETTDLNRTSLLPDFCRNRYVLPTLLLAELLAITLCLSHYDNSILWLVRLGVYSLFAQWIAILSIALLCLARKHLSGLSDINVSLISYTLILLVTTISSVCFWYFAELPSREVLFGDNLWHFLGRLVLITAIMAGLVIRYFYVQHAWRCQIAMQATARLQALQAKIRPHFLFNTMNMISTTIHSDPHKADDLIVKLCELLRAGLHDSDNSVLGEELQLCRHYLDMEKIRLGDRLQIDWQIHELPGDARIPRLTLQPLLENAIYHGIETRPEGGLLRIHGQRKRNQLTIYLENPTGTSPNSASAHTGHGQALDNIRSRLYHYYDQQGELTLHEDNELFTVKLIIPYKPDRPKP